MLDNKPFNFTYSAKEQEEIKRIRSKYLPDKKEAEDKMERLRRIDRSVTKWAEIWALTVGILGALIMGSGMSLIMTELSSMLGMDAVTSIIVGAIVGLVGMALSVAAYPIYGAIIKALRKKHAPEILALTEELMK